MVVGLRVFGDYSLKVANPAKLVLNLTGTVDVTDNEKITGWIAEQLLKIMRTEVTQEIVRNDWPILGLSAYTPQIEQTVLEAVNKVLDEYGLVIVRMGNFDVNLSDEDDAQLKTLAKDTAYSRLAGSFNAYAAGEAAIGAGQGMAKGGGATGGAFLATGVGVGQQVVAPQPGAGAAPPPAPGFAGGGAGFAAGTAVKCASWGRTTRRRRSSARRAGRRSRGRPSTRSAKRIWRRGRSSAPRAGRPSAVLRPVRARAAGARSPRSPRADGDEGGLMVIGTLGARAGGGHGFGGGGGGGGGGGLRCGGGGGGLWFFGGGGGGTGGAIVGILLVVLIIGGLLFVAMALSARQRRRISRAEEEAGTVTPASVPHGDGPAYPPGSAHPWEHDDVAAVGGAVVGGAAGGAGGPGASGGGAAGGIAAIQAHDPNFSTKGFINAVERSVFVVEEAWSERKPEMSSQVMADGIWQQHKAQIDQYVANGTRNVMDGLAIGKVAIIDAASDNTYDTVTVRILATCADYDIEVNSGKVMRGNKHNMEPWQEDWHFQRSSRATTKAAVGTLHQKCPNCGAPLDVDLTGVCKYCRAPVMSGDYDWVVTGINQVMASA